MYEPKRARAAVHRAALQVFRSLGPYLSESVYQSALALELQAQAAPGETVMREVPRHIFYRNVAVGTHRYDILFGSAIVETKVSKHRTPGPSPFMPQVQRYLRSANRGEFVILVVFGTHDVRTFLFGPTGYKPRSV